MTDVLRPHDDPLARAVAALLGAPIPKGPPQELVARAQSTLRRIEAAFHGRQVLPDDTDRNPEQKP